MGYQALLFCPDDKTARTVTQVLSELEFTVEACIEPFAAVKKLMGQHFDAVVVDCDNEQNATLLFKSARNSTSNQTSLAVAVVEGQAGVAKAFRIGANLVLTKPINIEQTKGTLRVARGLLRKSEPAKPGAPAPAPAAPAAAAPIPAPPKPAAPKPVAAAPRPATPSTLPPKPVTAATPRPAPVAPPKPAAPPAWPTPTVAASSAPAVPDDDLLGIEPEKPAAAPAAAEIEPSFASPSFGGAASAPAPAREAHVPAPAPAPASPSEHFVEKPAASESSAYVGSAPSFSFGGTTTDSESSGGNKKIFIGAAAAVIVVAVGFFAWSHFKGSVSSTASETVPSASTAAIKPSTAQPPAAGTAVSTPAPAPTTSAAAPITQPEKPSASTTPSEEASDDNSSAAENPRHPSASSAKSSASDTPSKTATPDKPEPNALVVKGGKVPAQSKAALADAPPPSLIGMGAPEAAAPNLGTSSNNGFKPVLQTLSISQGVSQGLLLKKVAPSYPPNALRMRVEGAVELQATISKEGTITHIKVLSGDMQLTKAATDAVKQWKYKPYLLNGEPVEIQTQITVNFKMPR
jgi:protein TonB